MEPDLLVRPAPPADARLRYGPKPLQFGDLWLPDGDGPHPVVIVVHGGFWRSQYDLTHAGHLCAALSRAGLATWNIEYRRIGDAGGGWPGTFLDVALAADHIRTLAAQFPLDPDGVSVLGHSAGGHLALWLAARRRLPPDCPLYPADPLPLCGVVALAGIPDLIQAWDLQLRGGIVESLLEGTPATRPHRYACGSPIAHLPLGIPQILVHGTADKNVPFVTSERYVQRATILRDEATLMALPGAGHFELIDPESGEWPAVQRAVIQLHEAPSRRDPPPIIAP